MSLILVYINKLPFYLRTGMTILQACQKVNIDVPHFCYHEKLPVAGNCRMCLVEVSGSMKLVASCAVAVSSGIKIFTNTLRVKKSRESVLEFLLANHPLDCPICDQGGECDLQDITMVFGSDRGRFYEVEKRSVVDKDFGPLVKTVMNRCIHCTRCVRFAENLLGSTSLGTAGRGVATEIGSYVENLFDEELFANVVDLCPVGALTSKPSAFSSRAWELVSVESIDIMDSLCSSIRVDLAFNKIFRVLPRLNENLNSAWITNKARFIYDSFNIQRILKPQLNVSQFLPGVSLTVSFLNVSWNFAYEVILTKWLQSDIRQFYCGYFVDLYSCLSIRDFFNSFGLLNMQDSKALSSDFSFNYLFNLNFSVIEKVTSVCLILWSNIRFESPLLLVRLRKSLNAHFTVVYAFGLIDIHYLNNVYQLGNSMGSFLRFVEGFNPLLYKLVSNSLDFMPLIIVGQSFNNMASEFGAIKIIYFFLGQLYRFGSGYILHYFHFNYLDFFKNVCFVFNYCISLHVNLLNLNFQYDMGFMRYYCKETSLLRRFIFLFGFEADFKTFMDMSGAGFIVYQGTHGDIGALNADIILPTPLYLERESLYLNMSGVFQRVDLAVISPPQSYSESEVLLTLWSKFVSKDIYFHNINDLSYVMLNYDINYWGFLKDTEKIGQVRLDSLLPNRAINFWHWNNLDCFLKKTYVWFYFSYIYENFFFGLDFNQFNFGNYYVNPTIYMYYRNDLLSKFSKTMSLCFNKTLKFGFSFF